MYQNADVEKVSKAVEMWINHSKRRVFRANGGSSGSSSNESPEGSGGKTKIAGANKKLRRSGKKNGDDGATPSSGDAQSGDDRRHRGVQQQDGVASLQSGRGQASPNTGQLHGDKESSEIELEEEFEDANDAPVDDGEFE